MRSLLAPLRVRNVWLKSWDAARMGIHPSASITWADALGWRMERHLLDPVGSDSVADVVRRLGTR